MIFEKLANLIYKRSKLIVIVWILILICSVPFALKAGEVLDYDTTNMAGPDAESLKGAEVMAEYFYQSDIQMESAVLIVAGFDDNEGKVHALGMYDAINSELDDFTDPNGDRKIPDGNFMVYGVFPDKNATEGVVIYALIYNEYMTEEGLVVDDTPALRSFVSDVLKDNNMEGVTVYVTGSPAISYDTEAVAMEDISKIDVFSILMILILVGLFFRSFVTSAMPPMTIGAAFGVTLCLMYLVGSVLDIFYITQMLLLVSMLGAGCDYCIFILARYREERVNGADHEHALKGAVTWAGESITTSGIAVMIGFGAMSICSFSMISTMGIMLAIGIVVALLAALTLISSLLAIFGDRLFWPTRPESLKEGGKANKGWYGKVSRVGHKYFTKSAHASIKYAKLIIVAAVLFTIPMAYIMSTSESSYDMIGAMASGEAIDGLNEVEEYTNGGMIMPNYAILELGESIGTIDEFELAGSQLGILTWNAASDQYLERLSTLSSTLYEEDNLGEIWGVYQWGELAEKAAEDVIKEPTETNTEYTLRLYAAMAESTEYLPDTLGREASVMIDQIVNGYAQAMGDAVYNDPYLIGLMDYIINYEMSASVGGTINGTTIDMTFVKYTLITKDAAMSDRSMDTLNYVDSSLSVFAADNADMISAVWLTGSAVVMYEISELVGDEFLKVEIIAILLIFILLFAVMKSYVTPIRSILTILMSVVWTVALTHIIFGNLLGDGVIWMIPIILLVVCLGLGMDYDILLTTRIKENHLYKGMTNDDAITHAVTHSGSVITICGLIMGGAFGTLMLSSTTMLQEFGFALCFAIIVDALIVRTYIVPAAMHLLGEWNWKGPKFMHRNVPKQSE